MPTLWKSPTAAKLTRLPYFPLTANMLAFGPLLGPFVYFPAKFKLKVLDPVTMDVAPDQDRYSRSHIMDVSEGIRQSLQEALLGMLADRSSVWFG
jgi:hypothetical protein